MNCFVTGAAGFIGSALLHRLSKEGHNVTGLIHKTKGKYRSENVCYVRADITNKKSLEHVITDCDIVFHCAAFVKDFGRKKDFYQINFMGTKNLVEACEKQGVTRFIYLGHLQYESSALFSFYSETKKMAEEYLLERFYSTGFPVVIIHPGNVYGPGATTWVLRLVESIKKNRIRLIDNGEGIFHHTYIDNLIDALVLAMTGSDRVIGRTFDVTDGDTSVTWREYLNALAEMVGCDPVSKSIPKHAALCIGYLMMIGYHFFGIEPLVTPMAIQVFTNRKEISIETAKMVLGYQPKIDFQSGMNQVRKWLHSEGLVK